ncbi:MAG: hypothetical protein HY815_08095 [Candidatus Riflebacteria bacterium]|nr:hypothetical protein [Candidatus Riflebacteria bacterium]
MDVSYTKRAGRPCAELAWMGNDENDDWFGRGLAWIAEDGPMTKTIFMVQSDGHIGKDSFHEMR